MTAGSSPQKRRGRKPEPPPPPRFNQYKIVRNSTIVLSVLGVFFLGSALLTEPDVELRSGPSVAHAERRLVQTLEQLRAAWDPQERATILEQAKANTAVFEGHLRRVLRQHDHPLIEQAAEYAGAMQDPMLLDALTDLAKTGPASARPNAIRAVEQLRAWPSPVLSEFLSNDITPVQIAAFQVVSRRFDVPWETAFDLLTSEYESVREAAMQSVPADLPEEAGDVLWGIVTGGNADESTVALRALARTRLVGRYEERAAALLPTLGEPEQRAVLGFLATKGEPLSTPRPVLELALDYSANDEIRTAALHCLELTESYDADALRASLYEMSPVLRFCVARCFLRSGDAEGAGILFGLLEEEEDGSGFKLRTRQLLSRLTGLAPGASADDFRAAMPSGTELVDALTTAAPPH